MDTGVHGVELCSEEADIPHIKSTQSAHARTHELPMLDCESNHGKMADTCCPSLWVYQADAHVIGHPCAFHCGDHHGKTAGRSAAPHFGSMRLMRMCSAISSMGTSSPVIGDTTNLVGS